MHSFDTEADYHIDAIVTEHFKPQSVMKGHTLAEMEKEAVACET